MGSKTYRNAGRKKSWNTSSESVATRVPIEIADKLKLLKAKGIEVKQIENALNKLNENNTNDNTNVEESIRNWHKKCLSASNNNPRADYMRKFLKSIGHNWIVEKSKWRYEE
jgi:DNA-binding FadR family transcriptional regulator